MGEILTASLTILVAVILFILNELTLKPISEMRKLIGEVAYHLMYFAKYYANPTKSNLEQQIGVGNELRDMASKLYAYSVSISPKAYYFLRWFRKMPTLTDIQKSVSELIFISNSVTQGKPIEIHNSRKKIEKLLRFNFFV
ncbi:MAG TPA: hypothetical protein VJI97_02005 [Candidatus Nanoarchaeia archaeon]|nr:hypothetical protein [Candidatus Nanoarchaeia archaeon]